MERDPRFPEDLSQGQIDALLAGRSVIHGQKPKTLADFGIAAADPAAESLAAKLANAALVRLENENAQLSRDLSAARKARFEAEKSAQPVDLAPYELFLPKTKAEIGKLGIDELKALAKIRNVVVEGDDKATYVAALSPKDGA